MKEKKGEMEAHLDYNLFHVPFVIVGAELVRGLKDNYLGSTVIFRVMHTLVLKMLCYTAVCCVAYL